MDAPQVERKQVQALQIVIQWVPELGKFQVGWPEVDDVVKFGMLEFAKATLLEHRAKVATGQGGGLVIPAGKMPH